ncbi:hypothetical protein K503DRAFT_870304, partial [Rhizopogon vinicolor AM-OR11-026]
MLSYTTAHFLEYVTVRFPNGEPGRASSYLAAPTWQGRAGPPRARTPQTTIRGSRRLR